MQTKEREEEKKKKKEKKEYSIKYGGVVFVCDFLCLFIISVSIIY